VYAVKAQLHQVFINLITNACQAMPAGKGPARARGRALGEPGGLVTVRVRDNGRGIQAEKRRRVFERSTRRRARAEARASACRSCATSVLQHRGDIRGREHAG